MLITGEHATGKTSLLQSFVGQQFKALYYPTTAGNGRPHLLDASPRGCHERSDSAAFFRIPHRGLSPSHPKIALA
ncbi:MAG: hypothetical protein JW839_16755 [Candidatus Lokiarchaeota archaeon]|nr:hypothetical protein [Candidatus Lokiarchaeota archaeon]